MDDEATAMREQMDQTLGDLTDKLGKLEDQISGTVRTVRDSVNTVRDTFDLSLHVRQRPLTLLGAAMALGFLGGYRQSDARSSRAMRNSCGCSAAACGGVSPGNPPVQPSPTWLANLADKFQPEIAAVKGMAVGAVFEVAHEIMRKQVVAPISRAMSGEDTEAH